MGDVGTLKIGKVLLVEDHAQSRAAWRRQFALTGIEVLEASNRKEALDRTLEVKPDLAIVDLFLESCHSGIDVIRGLKACDPDLCCVLVSAHLTVAHALMAVRAGAADAFFKPFTAKQVLQRLEHGAPPQPEPGAIPTLDDIEREHITRILADHRGNISHTAEALGIHRQSLQRKIQRHAPRPHRDGPVPRRSRRLRDSEY